MKKCLVVGFGSIGKRHSDILKNLGCDVSLVTSQQAQNFVRYSSITEAFKNNYFDYVVVANSTHLHFDSLNELIHCNYRGVVLVEKPLYSSLKVLPPNKFSKLFVAYNLRFSKPLLILKEILENDKLISFSANVGQYLPTWRSNRDYRESYSARKELGGGVLADLSHELDYSIWLCGKSLEVTARGGHFSDLEINSDDIYSILMRCQFCPIVNIQMNYLDRIKRRELLIHTKKHSIFIDLLKGTFNLDGELIETNDSLAETYLRQHESILNNNYNNLSSYKEGIEIVTLMQKITEANKTKKWILA